MKMTRIKKMLSLIVCIVLIAAMALLTVGCSGEKTSSDGIQSETVGTRAEAKVIGQGEKSFYLTVTDADGKESLFEVKTNKKTVGEALQELKFISGEEGPYGLYVKTVNGITIDYDKDKKYWAFYIKNEYANGGIDTIEISDGTSYAFKVE